MQSTTAYQQDYLNYMHDLNNAFPSMYKPQAQDHTNTYNPSCFEPPYDNCHMSSGQTNESNFDHLTDTEAWISE